LTLDTSSHLPCTIDSTICSYKQYKYNHCYSTVKSSILHHPHTWCTSPNLVNGYLGSQVKRWEFPICLMCTSGIPTKALGISDLFKVYIWDPCCYCC